MKTKIGILISGRGSNMLALAAAVREGRVPNAEIAVVISDQPGAAGLAHAQSQKLPTAVVERRGRTRDEHDREVVSVLQEHQVDFVCLAGYMRLLSSHFLSAYDNRILNIHPSLLPAFPGLDAQRQALEHGAKFSGCTVHFVDQTLDGGPIIAQRVVPILADDTEATLSARILEEEHKLYAEALAIVASGAYEIVGRRVVLK
ncbi:MAG TPA: phosphoribosylglycinamide formyltransferase [Pyrinomonadaceae bacterium]|nr:phosphoribosylglycinamide formyltransferase [Pyrinomonadaceae bacterium]